MDYIFNFITGHSKEFWLSVFFSLASLVAATFCFVVSWEGQWSPLNIFLYVASLLICISFIRAGINYDKRMAEISARFDARKALIGLGAHCCSLSCDVFSVSTPICFRDGCTVNLYVHFSGTKALVSDDGNTLMRFHSMGAGNSSSLESNLSMIARNHGGELINGRFVFKAQSITKAYANCCDAMRQVVDQEEILKCQNQPTIKP